MPPWHRFPARRSVLERVFGEHANIEPAARITAISPYGRGLPGWRTDSSLSLGGGERDPFAVGGRGFVRVVTGRVRETFQVRPVCANGADLAVTIDVGSERNEAGGQTTP
jgi:hypothetical protein